MADDNMKKPGSITQPADNRNERISEISNVSRAISNMQKQIDQKLTEIDRDTGNADAINAVQSSMTKVLQKMSNTVGEIGRGFSSIAYSLANTTKEIPAQYYRAATQEVNYDKEKMLAMTLAKASPVFGYYVSKFMETDIWKNATEKMKANIGRALSSVGTKVKGLFTSKKSKNEIPHMQRGGVVKRGGVAQLHAAEVVMPVDKLLDRIDEQTSVTKTYMRSMSRYQQASLAKMDTYVGRLDKIEKEGLFKGFLRAMEEVQTQYEEPAEQRMLRALLAIQDALGAQIGTWTQVWQKMLVNHPTFRTTVFLSKRLADIFTMPGKIVYRLFKARGGYPSHLSKSNQPFEALNENVGILYSGTMYRLDAVAMYTRATAEATRHISSAITGTQYRKLPGISTGKWSLFKYFRKTLNILGTMPLSAVKLLTMLGAGKRRGQVESAFNNVIQFFGKERLARSPFHAMGLAIGKGQAEKIYGSEEEVKMGESQKNLAKYMPKQVVAGLLSHSAFPVYDVDGPRIEAKQEKRETKIWKRTQELSKQEKKKEQKRLSKLQKHQEKVQWQIEKVRANRRKKAQKIANKIAREHLKASKKANAMRRRQTIFKAFTGGFGAVKSLLGTVMGTLGSIFLGGGGPIGIMTRLIRSSISGGIKLAFMGKAGGTIIKGFIKGLGPSMAILGKNMLGSVGALKSFLASPGFLKTFGSLAGVAAAGVIGWKIGKRIDDWFGISEKFKAKMNEWDKKFSVIAAEVGAKTSAALAAAKKGGVEGYKGKRAIKLSAQLGQFTIERQKSVGYFGRGHIATIQEAQRAYMFNNINEYMKYSPDTLAKARRSWVAYGYRPKAAFEDAESYGKRREESFLKYLKGNKKQFKPLTETQIQEGYAAYEAKHGRTPEGELMLNKPTLKESMIGYYKKTTDIARNQITESILTNQALKQAAEYTKEAIASNKEQLEKTRQAINAGTVVVSNTVHQASTTTVNAGQRGINYVQDQYGLMINKGEIDGD